MNVKIKETSKGRTYMVEVDGKTYKRNTKNVYTHAVLAKHPEGKLPYGDYERISFHRSKDLAERTMNQYPAGTTSKIIVLEDTNQTTKEVTFGKKEFGYVKASNGYKIQCKVFPVEEYRVFNGSQHVKTFDTLRQAKQFVKSLG